MHYFDWTATSRPTERVKKKVVELLEDTWGNPSSSHGVGNDAARELSLARKNVLCGIGFGKPAAGRLIFTSGGTEANNLAVLGAAYAKSRRGCILISDGEHPSVEMCARALESDGFKVIRIPTSGGKLDIDSILAVDEDISLASFMLVNNETGAIYDIAAAARSVRRRSPDAFIHTDAVQGFMKIRFTPAKLGVNAVTVSAHKIGGIKGTGALYVDDDSIKKRRISPRLLGGGQEAGLRSGTENMPGICAFAEAVNESLENFDERSNRVAGLRELLSESLAGTDIRINEPPSVYPGIVSITVPGVRSETLLNFASQNGVYVSAGSACSSHSNKKSLALSAFGLTEAEMDSTIRVSLSHINTEDEITILSDVLIRAKSTLHGLKSSVTGKF